MHKRGRNRFFPAREDRTILLHRFWSPEDVHKRERNRFSAREDRTKLLRRFWSPEDVHVRERNRFFSAREDRTKLLHHLWWPETTILSPDHHLWWPETVVVSPDHYLWWPETTILSPDHHFWWPETTILSPDQYVWWRDTTILSFSNSFCYREMVHEQESQFLVTSRWDGTPNPGSGRQIWSPAISLWIWSPLTLDKHLHTHYHLRWPELISFRKESLNRAHIKGSIMGSNLCQTITCLSI